MAEEKGEILIVDDEDSIRKLVARKLSSEGYRCQEAGDAAEALEKLNASQIGLVLLDIKMPGKSGIELLPEIQARFPDTAVVMATAMIDIDVAVESMRLGAYDYIAKPFNLDDVFHSVRRAMEKRRLVLENRGYQEHLKDRVAEQAGRIRASFFNAIRALVYALEARDDYTSGHSQRVADVAAVLARKVGTSQEFVDNVVFAGLVHDIGKIGVSELVLNKRGSLTTQERQHMQRHSEIGERIIGPIAADEEILKLVRNHHERFDGSGYPDGLKQEQIPLGARILAIADAFEAMTSERPYRKAMSPQAAYAEIERCKGSQFDPELANLFMRDIMLRRSGS